MNLRQVFPQDLSIERWETYLPAERYTLEDLLRLEGREFSSETARQVWTEPGFDEESLYEFFVHQTSGCEHLFRLPDSDDAEAFTQHSGIGHVHCAGNESASDMAVTVGNKILASSNSPNSIDLLIYYSSALNERPMWSTAFRLQHELHLKKVLAFAVGQKSGNAVMAALRVARDMMSAESKLRTALLVGSEKRVQPFPRSFGQMTLIGDSAAAMILAKSGARRRLLDLEIRDFTDWWNPGKLSQARLRGFEDFVSVEAAQVAAAVLERQNLRLDDVKLLLPPNFSLSLARKIGEQLKVPQSRLYASNISRYGFLLTSDMLVNLAGAVADHEVGDNDIVVIVTLGLGLSVGAAVLRI